MITGTWHNTESPSQLDGRLQGRGKTKVTFPNESELHRLLESHCEAGGLKEQNVMNAALAAYLEETEDLALVEQRRAAPVGVLRRLEGWP